MGQIGADSKPSARAPTACSISRIGATDAKSTRSSACSAVAPVYVPSRCMNYRLILRARMSISIAAIAMRTWQACINRRRGRGRTGPHESRRRSSPCTPHFCPLAIISRCPAASRRRERRTAFTDDAADEILPPARRARDQPVDELVTKPVTATADASPSTDAAGEKLATPPSPNRPGIFGSAFISYGSDTLCHRLPTPQVLPRRARPDLSSRRAAYSTTCSCRRSRCAQRSCSQASAIRRSSRASRTTLRRPRSRRTGSCAPPSRSRTPFPTCSSTSTSSRGYHAVPVWSRRACEVPMGRPDCADGLL